MYCNKMLIIPSLPSSSSSFASPFSTPHSAAAAPSAPLFQIHCSQVEKEPGMEALRSSLRPETVGSPPPPPQQQQNQEVVVSEKGGLLVESFSVDELLNLWEFGENEKENEEERKVEAVAGDCCNANVPSSSPPSSSSALSYEGSRPLSEITLPAHDAEEFEWVSLFMDDSLTEFPTGVAPFASQPQAQNRSDNGQREGRQQPHGAVVAAAHVASLPCATVCAVSTEAPVPPKAKRSKRSRTIAVGWSTSLPFTDFSSTTSASSCSSSSSSSLSPCLIYDQFSATGDQSFLLYESHPSSQLPPPPPPASKKTKLPKKRGRKPKQLAAAASASCDATPHGERRCSHCGAQKTPQWRAGPKGAKTLCNACGVRYKSGRLLPEYRPACSPTYVDSIHSSSHRKVLELRRQKEAELLLHAIGPQPVATC